MIATEASVVNLESGFAALQALLAPLSLPPPAVTHYVNRLVSPHPYGLWPARFACVMRARCAPCLSRGSLRSAMDIATRAVDNQACGLPCGAVDKRHGQAASPSCGSLRDLTTA